MKTPSKLILSAICAATLTLPATAGDPLRGAGDDLPSLPGHPIRNLISAVVHKALDFRKDTPLSTEQKTALAGILQSHHGEIRSQIITARDARRAMAEAVEKTGAYSPDTYAAAARIGEAARERALLLAKVGSKAKPILTAEQLASLESGRSELQAMIDKSITDGAQ